VGSLVRAYLNLNRDSRLSFGIGEKEKSNLGDVGVIVAQSRVGGETMTSRCYWLSVSHLHRLRNCVVALNLVAYLE
jgi:hypothetical protein